MWSKHENFLDEIYPELTVLLSSCCCKPLFANSYKLKFTVSLEM